MGLLLTWECCLLGLVISVKGSSKGQQRSTAISQNNPGGHSWDAVHLIGDENPAAQPTKKGDSLGIRRVKTLGVRNKNSKEKQCFYKNLENYGNG